MSKEILDQIEFEKSKREILKQNKPTPIAHAKDMSDKRFAWEIELEQYKKRKALESFHTFGAIMGIIACVLTILFHLQDIQAFLMKF